jgi:hypothetical protein
MTTETETAGASYIISFYQQVQVLTHNYGNYVNLMLEVENKYGKEAQNVEAEVKNVITAQVQEVRLGVMKTYIMYKSICAGAGINEPNYKDIEVAYNNIKENFVIKKDAIEKYVIALNAALVNDVIKNLLATGQALFSNVYGQQQYNPNA